MIMMMMMMMMMMMVVISVVNINSILSYPIHVTLCHVTSCHVTSCHVTPCHIMSCHIMSCHVTSCHVTSRHVTSRHVTSRHVTSRHGLISSHLRGECWRARLVLAIVHGRAVRSTVGPTTAAARHGAGRTGGGGVGGAEGFEVLRVPRDEGTAALEVGDRAVGQHDVAIAVVNTRRG